MTIRRPVSFIATENPDETGRFYGDVLGLELIEQTAFAVVFEDGGHVLRVQIVPDFVPASHTAHGWTTDDIVAQINALSDKGVQFLQFDGLAQDGLGVWSTPDGHKIAWFKDPSGNILSLTQYQGLEGGD